LISKNRIKKKKSDLRKRDPAGEKKVL